MTVHEQSGQVGGNGDFQVRTERHISSGGVVFRRRDGITEIALIAVREGRVWCLPKGHVEKGENIARTAHREVREETGLDGRIVKLIGNIHYFYVSKEEGEARRIFKIVYFFLMEYTGGDVAGHDSEVYDCRWFPVDEAVERAEYKDEKGILIKAMEMLRL